MSFQTKKNIAFCLEQMSRTVNFDANSKLRQLNLDLKSRFMEFKSINPKSEQNRKAREIGYSSCTLQRYRHSMKR